MGRVFKQLISYMTFPAIMLNKKLMASNNEHYNKVAILGCVAVC